MTFGMLPHVQLLLGQGGHEMDKTAAFAFVITEDQEKGKDEEDGLPFYEPAIYRERWIRQSRRRPR